LDPFGNQDVQVTLPNCEHLTVNESFMFFAKIDFESLEKLVKITLHFGKDERWSLKEIGQLIERNRCNQFDTIQIIKDDGFLTLDEI